MDYGTSGSIFTVLVFVFFIGIVLWAYSKKAKPGFDEAANLVFDDEKDINPNSNKKAAGDNSQ